FQGDLVLTGQLSTEHHSVGSHKRPVMGSRLWREELSCTRLTALWSLFWQSPPPCWSPLLSTCYRVPALVVSLERVSSWSALGVAAVLITAGQWDLQESSR